MYDVLNQNQITWSEGAQKRIASIPFFIRPFVKRRIEAVARERSIRVISDSLVDELKRKEMP